MKTVVASRLRLGFDRREGWIEIPFEPARRTMLSRLWRALCIIARLRNIDAVFASNPHLPELLFIWIAKRLSFGRIRTFVFDLILRSPVSRADQVLAFVRRALLASVDVFLCIHKDISGYTRFFGVPVNRCLYIPFKANNFDLAQSIVSIDGDYLLTLGASHRDYKTLVEAVRGTDIPTTILLPKQSISLHNAVLGDDLPSNVRHLDVAVDRQEWSQLIAKSRIVAVPILPGVLQPAGISVYLEAMIFGKPVIVSRGSSTDKVLNSDIAVLVAPGDSDALRDAILFLWNDSSARKLIGARARQYATSLGDHQRLIADIRSAIRSHVN